MARFNVERREWSIYHIFEPQVIKSLGALFLGVSVSIAGLVKLRGPVSTVFKLLNSL